MHLLELRADAVANLAASITAHCDLDCSRIAIVSPASPHFVWQDYLWWRGRAPRSRRRIRQGSLIASLLWDDAASHAGAS